MVDQVTENTHPQVHTALSNVFMVASGKGGVGKTWFSISLAHSLAREGKNVLIFDGDLGLANIDIQLGLMPEKDLSSVIAGKCTLSEAIYSYKNIMIPEGYPGKLDILPGRSGSGTLSRLSVQRLMFLRQGLRAIAPQYDYVIIDLGAGIGGTVRALSPIASKAFVITMDEPTALTDAYAFMKVMHTTENPNLEMHIVVNQADSERGGLRTYEALSTVCQNFLKFKPELLGVIRQDIHVPDSIRHQIPMAIRHPNSQAQDDLTRITEKVLSLPIEEDS